MVRQSKQTHSGPPLNSATRIIPQPDRKRRVQPDQKKDTHKKKTQQQDKPSSKTSDSTIWPCRINGCNKQFAREADLKRHQRTTKLHSVPGFACPQCDARFTRTDALRRHQKSRHNGVVIEPTDSVDRMSMRDEDPHSSGSRSKSRSRTPAPKENPAAPPSLPPTTVPPGGPQSYYRQHTFAGVMMPPPGVMVDGHYSSAVGLPTSATRLHQASWQPAPPWGADGSQPPPPHMIHPGYAQPYYNSPPQYYRPGTTMHPPPPDVVAHQQVPNGISSSNNGESSLSRKASPVMAVDPSLDRPGMEDPSEAGDAETAVIDPSLVSPSASSADNGESSTDGRVPEAGSSPSRGKHVSSPGSAEPPNEQGNDSDREMTIVQNLLSPDRDHPYPSHSAPLERPPEMEQMLTEDGEPMLNPAELLTQVSMSNVTSTVLDLMLQILRQESLASPPPS